ncbi:MAG: glycosyl transferase family 2 [Chloroflexi bacterium RBG_16_57_11]|nr:MAG: glycosyl transferase family 2 [Chloroflexi bacterium RBG_16_57_11]
MDNFPGREDEYPRIVVVIPAYRAEKFIIKILSGIPPFVSNIVVVDDCSPDRTAELVYAFNDSRICLVSHETNQGVGKAMLTGYCKALELGAKIIVKMDSDDQMDPAYLVPLIAPILTGQADYTKGNRFLHANELKAMPFIRRIGNAGLSFLTKAASGYWNLFDPTNGYTAIHTSVVPLLDTTKIHPRYFFESSMLIELGMHRAVIRDVYIPARYGDGFSSLSVWKTLIEFPPRLFSAFLRRFMVQYFIRDFGIVSVLFLAGLLFSGFGLIFGGYQWYKSAVTGTVAPTGTVMVATLPLILGSQLLIQALVADIQSIPQEPIHNQLDALERLNQALGK